MRRFGLMAALLGLLSAGSLPAAEPVVALKPAHVRTPVTQLIRNLSHDRYAVRQQATRELAQRGPAAIPKLLTAAESTNPETSHRSFLVLERMYVDLNADDKALDQVESSLETLKQVTDPTVSQHATRILERHSDIRERRAVAAIERLGGIVRYLPEEYRQAPFVEDANQIHYVILSRKWRGGDDGLKYVRRLSGVRNLYVAGNAKFQPVSEKALAAIAREMPNLQVQKRGLSCLGVSGQVDVGNGVGCYITHVQPGSAAAKGGLQVGDLIRNFGGKPVNNFETLVKLIGEHDPGESVEVGVLHNGRIEKRKVVLQEWTK